ncbi:coiled-coil domain-containing protein 33 isoform X1 [Anguilla rostrata]|uniref:coiled-coil domain-containing protein 33 isoform X1 n=1 Tax=Anguilla rostrata TaxID=7938 RepID=UPI0030D313D8
MQRSHLRIEEKELDFEFKVVTVQFNERGRYILTLTVENPLLEDSSAGVQLRVNDEEVLHTSRGSTEPIQQGNLDEIYTCLRSKFVFTLPKGFCKNDKNHDVRLRVEAVRLTDSQSSAAEGGGGARAGEGFFAIFPRTDAPRINPFARRDEELYRYSGIMALLRVHDDYLAMHCGRLAYAVAFHESRPSPSPADDVRGSARVDDMSEWKTPRAPSPGPSSIQVPPLVLGSAQLPDHAAASSDPAQPGDPKTARVTPHPSPRPAPQSHLKPEIEPDAKMDTSTEDLPTFPRNEAPLPSQRRPPVLTPTPDKVPRPLHEDIDTQSPRLLPPTLVTETPPERNEDPCSPLSGDWQVSYPGRGAITVTLHGASSLHPRSDGGVPRPFVIVKCGTVKDEAHGPRSLGVTHCSLQPTHCPSWGEKITVELQDEQAHGEVLTLSVADSQSRELLVSYQIPAEHLVPFHHYNLELLQEHSSVPEGVQLYVSLVRRISMLPRLPHFSFTGFEVLLQALERPLREPAGPLVAVARIVPDYDSYRDYMLQTPRAAGIAMTSVTFPHPSDFAFAVPPLSSQGQLQVSPAGVPEEQPVWNHCFLFLGRDCATIFTGEAALVLEYYPTTTVMNSVSWYTCSPIGLSALILDQQLYGKLMSETGLKGLRVEQLPLQGSMLKTTSDTTPSVGIILRLIGSERPDSLLTEVVPSVLPCLDLEPLEEAGAPCVPERPPVPPLLPEECVTLETATPITDRHAQLQLSFQRKGLGLPSYDALAQILPEYQHLFRAPKAGPQHAQQPKPRPKGGPTESEPHPSQDSHALNETYRLPATHTRNPAPEAEDDPNTAEVAEHQTRELENYRTAMQKMADDIITLRRQVGELESENSRLRTDLSLHHDVGRTLLDDTDIDVMTKAEIADRIMSLKFKLASETSTAATQRDKIQQLQNELIKKNDGAKELIRLQRAHQQQQAALQRCQNRLARAGALEATVRQQEKVIEKMEKVLDNKLRGKNKENAEKSKQGKKPAGEEDNRRKEIESVLAAENSRLRAELERLRLQPLPIIIQQPMQKQVVFPDSERLSLLSQLERANARIRTLESQLNENSRHWGKEKQDMLTRLSEQDHGFTRTSSMILHNLPLKSASLSAMGPPGRHRQLDPLK